jgi:SAM-dependent methyltransferase
MAVPLDEALAQVRAAVLDRASLRRAVASGRRRGGAPRWRRVELRPVELRSGPRLQVTAYDERQAFTSNHGWDDVGPQGAAAAVDALLAEGFGHWNVETADAALRVRVTKRGEALVGRERPDHADHPEAVPREHDRAKPRLLDPGAPYLREVGIADARGRVRPSRQDKYRQVEEFLRLLSVDLTEAIGSGRVTEPTAGRPLRIVDLGCGNAYLTFAAVAWLDSRGWPAEVVGVDVKAQARERNSALAASLGWADRVRFVAGEIATAQWTFATPREGTAVDAPDVVLALHACDTATDDALARAVRWQAPVLLAAPCCHHDLQAQLRQATPHADDAPMLRHGILRERLGDVLTDGLRAHLLRLLGHRVEVVEFVPSRHTPRNVMLRAHRTGAPAAATVWAEYDQTVAHWGVHPVLARLLDADLADARPR